MTSHVDARLPRDLGDVNGVTVALQEVQIECNAGIVMRLGVRPSTRTRALDAIYHDEVARWMRLARVAKARGHEPPEPPTPPGLILEALSLRVTDDAGTQYRQMWARAAGTGTEWEAVRMYAPLPPSTAGQLTIVVEGHRGTPCHVSI